MKKIYILAIALFAGTGVFAQDAAKQASTTSSEGPAAGNIYLSGMVGFSSEGTKDKDGNKTTKGSSFDILPVAGYMINEKLGLQALIGYNSSSVDMTPDNEGGKSGSNTFSFGVGAKYFMGKGKFFFSPSANFVYGSSTNKNENIDGNGAWSYEKSGSANTVSIKVLPAVTYFFNSNWSGEFALGSLGYASTTSKDADGDKYASNGEFALKADLTEVKIGLSYWFK